MLGAVAAGKNDGMKRLKRLKAEAKN